ncbi:hypothetical protein CH275_21035 [Rhodococcus sp. 06-235-1A]|nr:hypothetical protein CH275_21035 [Rhodococcus sp. 06-235-1A]
MTGLHRVANVCAPLDNWPVFDVALPEPTAVPTAPTAEPSNVMVRSTPHDNSVGTMRPRRLDDVGVDAIRQDRLEARATDRAQTIR